MSPFRCLRRSALVGVASAVVAGATLIGCSSDATTQVRTFDGVTTGVIERKPDAAASPISVLLLHGAAYDASVWERTGLIKNLTSGGYRVTAIDLPGHGNTAALPAGTTPAGYLSAVATAVGGGSSTNVVVVAPSMSGTYLLPALDDGLQLAGVVTVAPVGGASFNPADSPKVAKALAVRGVNDKGFSEDDNKNLASRFMDGTAVSLPDAGHAAYEDQPQQFNKLVDDFLRGLASK